jgi:hypothetical protein
MSRGFIGFKSAANSQTNVGLAKAKVQKPWFGKVVLIQNYIKKRLDDHTSAESQVNQITKILLEAPKDEYQKTFEKWMERMQLCINNKGDYFEYLIK